MANRRMMFVAVWITVLCLVPGLAYAGAGGSPPAPGAAAAGTAAQYCCSTLSPATIGDGKSAITVLEGTGCTAVKDDDAGRNSCAVGTKKGVRCRGEIFDPFAQTVSRCFSP